MVGGINRGTRADKPYTACADGAENSWRQTCGDFVDFLSLLLMGCRTFEPGEA